MKIKEGLLLRKVAGKPIVLPVGDGTADFNEMVTLNESGAFLWSQLEQDVTKEELIDVLENEYLLDRNQSQRDVERFLAKLEGAGFIAPMT